MLKPDDLAERIGCVCFEDVVGTLEIAFQVEDDFEERLDCLVEVVGTLEVTFQVVAVLDVPIHVVFVDFDFSVDEYTEELLLLLFDEVPELLEEAVEVLKLEDLVERLDCDLLVDEVALLEVAFELVAVLVILIVVVFVFVLDILEDFVVETEELVVGTLEVLVEVENLELEVMKVVLELCVLLEFCVVLELCVVFELAVLLELLVLGVCDRVEMIIILGALGVDTMVCVIGTFGVLDAGVEDLTNIGVDEEGSVTGMLTVGTDTETTTGMLVGIMFDTTAEDLELELAETTLDATVTHLPCDVT